MLSYYEKLSWNIECLLHLEFSKIELQSDFEAQGYKHSFILVIHNNIKWGQLHY